VSLKNKKLQNKPLFRAGKGSTFGLPGPRPTVLQGLRLSVVSYSGLHLLAHTS